MTALYPIHVLPATDLYAYGLDAADMPHGLIVTNAPLFHEFVRTLVGASVEKLTEQNILLKSVYENALQGYETTLQQYEALLAAYERDTGRKWVHEEGE